jgi:hypothetical protein
MVSFPRLPNNGAINMAHPGTAREDSVGTILARVPGVGGACWKEQKMNNVLSMLSKVNGKDRSTYQGVVKRDWVPTGRIDFATHLNGNTSEETDQPNEFKLLVEERRIVESIAGNENLEIQWRLATLREAKSVVTQYHKYLSDNSLVKSVFEEALSLPAPKKAQGSRSA